MTDPLKALADRARDEPYFLAGVLAAYAAAERLSDVGLAEALGCAGVDLPMIQLCRTPRADAEGFRRDIDRICARFRLDPTRLAAVAKRGRVIARLQANEASADEPGYLMAARDRESSPEGNA